MAASVPRKTFTGFTADTTASSLDGAERAALIPPLDTGPPRKLHDPLRARLLKLFNDNHGLLLIGASQFFSSCMGLSVQMLSRLEPPILPAEILVVRMTVTWILTVAYMWYQGISHCITGPPEVRLLLVIRGVSGFCGVFGVYYSLQYLSLSDATVLTFLSPFVTSLTGIIFLREEFSRRKLFAGVFSLLGVVLIARPKALFGPSGLPRDGSPDSSERGTPHERVLAVAAAMIGVFGVSGAYTSLRAIGKRAHALHSMTYFAMFTGIISATLMVVERTTPVISSEWKWNALLVAISVFGFGAQLLLVMGLQRETASRGSLAMYIQIVFASLLERVFFHTTPSILSLSGTIIILSSAIYIALTRTKDEQHSRGRTERWTTQEEGSSLPPGVYTPELSEDTQGYPVHPPEERTALLEEGITVRPECAGRP